MGEGPSEVSKSVPNNEIYEVGGGYENYFEMYKDEAGEWQVRPTVELDASDWQNGGGSVIIVVRQNPNGPVIRHERFNFQFPTAPQETTAPSSTLNAGGGSFGKPWHIILLAALLLLIIVLIFFCILYKRRRERRGSYRPKHWESEKWDHRPTRPPYYLDSADDVMSFESLP